VAIWALSVGTRIGNSGKPYEYVETDTMVLDDGTDGSAATELVPAVHLGVEILGAFQHSTTGLVSRLKRRIGTTDKPMLGRINSQPSKVNKQVKAFSIAEPTPEDMALARTKRDMIKAHTEVIRARAQASEDAEAFS
jgi:hypothetical protein